MLISSTNFAQCPPCSKTFAYARSGASNRARTQLEGRRRSGSFGKQPSHTDPTAPDEPTRRGIKMANQLLLLLDNHDDVRRSRGCNGKFSGRGAHLRTGLPRKYRKD